MKPLEFLKDFDKFLETRGLEFEAIVIGGAALGIMGVITRETQDCDVLDPDIPSDVMQAAQEFGAEATKNGQSLKIDWLNNGPASLKDVLPKGWRSRLEPLFSGKAILLHSLGRSDLLKSKFFAYCDRDQDLNDCIAMKPTVFEIEDSLDWLKLQDANPGWPQHVANKMNELKKKLGYGV